MFAEDSVCGWLASGRNGMAEGHGGGILFHLCDTVEKGELETIK